MIVGVLATFDDQLIMDMATDEAVGEGQHGVAEDVPADSLDDVLDELGTVGFDPLPFLGAADAHVGDGFSAEAILADPRFDVGEHSAGGELDEEHAAPAEEADAVDLCLNPLPDGGFDRPIDVPPECDDHGIGGTPGVDQGLQLFFLEPHFEGTHGFQGADGSAVAEGQLSDLALLAQVSVDSVLDDRNAEHLAGGGTVDVLAFSEDLGSPGLAGEIRQDPGLDRGVI